MATAGEIAVNDGAVIQHDESQQNATEVYFLIL